MAESLELKRLTPVAEAASGAAALAGRSLTLAKSYVPERFLPTVEQAEGKVATLASPYVTMLTDKGAQALLAADAKVDSVILSAWQSYTANSEYLAAAVEKQRAAQAANIEAFTAARQQYLKRVEESVAFVKEQGLQGTTKAAADALLSKVEEARKVPEVLLSEISEAWTKFTHMPAVERLVAASKAQVEVAYTKYMAAHDALVADPRYGAAVAKGSTLLASLQATSAYKAAACRLTPLLAPYTESAAKLAGPYITAVANHLTPVA